MNQAARIAGLCMKPYWTVLAVAIATAPAAHSAGEHAGTHDVAFGVPGDPKKVTRVVRVDMADSMRYTPSEITVRQGDTVRFLLRNQGRQKHEMVIATLEDLKEHAATMNKHAGMEHGEANAVDVAPNKTRALVWRFTKAGTFPFACFEPGHFEAGMLGRITVQPIRKVDKDAKKLTIKHGPIPAIDMPPKN